MRACPDFDGSKVGMNSEFRHTQSDSMIDVLWVELGNAMHDLLTF